MIDFNRISNHLVILCLEVRESHSYLHFLCSYLRGFLLYTVLSKDDRQTNQFDQNRYYHTELILVSGSNLVTMTWLISFICVCVCVYIYIYIYIYINKINHFYHVFGS